MYLHVPGFEPTVVLVDMMQESENKHIKLTRGDAICIIPFVISKLKFIIHCLNLYQKSKQILWMIFVVVLHLIDSVPVS